MPAALPAEYQIVRIRPSTRLVEKVDADPGYASTVVLACLDDDAQGERSPRHRPGDEEICREKAVTKAPRGKAQREKLDDELI